MKILESIIREDLLHQEWVDENIGLESTADMVIYLESRAPDLATPWIRGAYALFTSIGFESYHHWTSRHREGKLKLAPAVEAKYDDFFEYIFYYLPTTETPSLAGYLEYLETTCPSSARTTHDIPPMDLAFLVTYFQNIFGGSAGSEL